METHLADFIKDTPEGRQAERILRTCTHCGFCTATCPTYQLLGDELDGPRGRIYLMKQALEGQPVTIKTQLHLDRCLTCRSCETTCPSGVRYGRLVDIGREVTDARVPRSASDRMKRRVLRAVLPYPKRFGPLLGLGRTVRPLLPDSLRRKVPARQSPGPTPERRHPRTMLILEGCVQPAIAPGINGAATRVLDRLGITLVSGEGAGCCGAVSYHLTAHEEGRAFMRRNIDAWWPHVESGIEAIVVTSSACAAMIKEYGELLDHDGRYAEKAARISALAKDTCQVLEGADPASLKDGIDTSRRIAFHSPCTLQHGEKLNGVVESLLARLGFELTPVPNAHLCCGSAGTYSLLQSEISQRLLRNKLGALESGSPEVIATGNIGCLAHLQSEAHVPVTHWIQLLDNQA
jgi:glycolate oxidase iron-sulfur subunit